jgi:uncharacterized protein (TIGR03067 family)
MVKDAVQSKGTLKSDPTQKPATIDFTFTEGKNQGETRLGIYKLAGDNLTFCFTEPNQHRPSKFVAKEGGNYTLFSLKRLKR